MTGKELQQLRLKLNLSQKEIGKKIGLSQKTISSFELGNKISQKALDKINSLNTDAMDITFEHQTTPTVRIKRDTPVTITLPNGITLTVFGNLKKMIKELS